MAKVPCYVCGEESDPTVGQNTEQYGKPRPGTGFCSTECRDSLYEATDRARAGKDYKIYAEYKDGIAGYAVCDGDDEIVKWFPANELPDAETLLTELTN